MSQQKKDQNPLFDLLLRYAGPPVALALGQLAGRLIGRVFGGKKKVEKEVQNVDK